MQTVKRENSKKYLSFGKTLFQILLLFILWSFAKAQPGTPNLKVYPPRAFSGDYHSGPQNIGIIQSKTGMMYFANSSGVLEFDGYYWRMIEGTYDLGPRDFAMDSAGVIYVGGKNNLGYLAPDSTGRLVFRSLLHLLDERDKEFNNIPYVFQIGDEIYFLSKRQLMKYKDNEIKVWQAKSEFSRGYVINDTLYFEQENMGLMKIIHDEIKLALPASEELSDFDKIHFFRTLCPCSERTEHLIGKDAGGNYFLFNGNENLVRINLRVSAFLNTQRIFKDNEAKTSDGKTVIGTLSGGVIVIDENGEFIQSISKENGSPDNIVNALFVDATDGLWIGHDNGISRTQLNSSLTFIDQSSGYTGIVVSITRFEGRLYLSTTDGVYVEKNSGTFNQRMQFERIAEIENQAFTLLEANNSLLVATILGVFEIKRESVKKIVEGIALDIFPSAINEKMVFAGFNDGIVSIEFIDGESKAGVRITGLNDVIYKAISEKNGVVWASNNADKIYKIDLSNYEVTNPTVAEFDSSDGVPNGWIEPFLMSDEVYFGSNLGVYQYDEGKKIFRHTDNEKFQYFNKRNRMAGPIRTDRQGNTWVVSNGKAGRVLPDSSEIYQWDSIATMGIPETSIWSIYTDNNDIVWLGATDFLVRYDTKVKRNNVGNFPAYVRSVVAAEDSLLFMGAGGFTISKPELKFKHNDIAFEFASPFYEGENVYSVKLEGNDEDWSQWSKETKIRYTNLGAGNYIFRVKAKNIYSIESSEAAYSFCVLPPFYLTIWAFMGYTVLVGLAVWGIVVFNSRRLIRVKKRLEGIVKERTKELSLTNEELKKAKEFEEQFLANMSHEIRTPMNSVVGLTNLMLKTDTNPRQVKYLKAIRQSADNMLVIINDILDVSKIQSGKLELDETDFSIRDVVEGALDVMQLAISEKGLKVQIKISDDLPDSVEGDPVRLNQIILNLVNNAVKFTEKGSITISCRVVEKNEPFIRLEFSVEDTGMGIAPENLDVIFANFGQGGKEIARKFGGTGLGLAICRQLIEMQQGKIGVKSEIGKGSTFFFDILYRIGHRKPLTEYEKKIILDDIRLENLKILLVENNDFNQMVAIDTLEELIKGVRVDVAGNGQEAISCILKNDYDLVLMDIYMPVMDGHEAARKIRHELPFPKNEVKIIAVSASSTKQEIEECIKAGMNDYLSKPFRMEELMLKIASLVQNEKSTPAKKESLTNLDFLEEMTGGNAVKKIKCINMYLDGAPLLISALKKGIENSDWKEIREAAHSLIPQFHYMGAAPLKKMAEEIELMAKSKSGMEEIITSAKELENAVNQTFLELKDFLETAAANEKKGTMNPPS